MFQLLSSFWLIALASLAVPVLIHLWHKKQPQVVKVGSLKWLAAAASKKANSLHFQDWPLLLLRCLLLAALVLFLTQPVWHQKIRPQNKKYVWVAPELLRAPHLSLIQSTLDSLVQQQYQLRQLARNFPALSDAAWTAIKQGEGLGLVSNALTNYWALAEQITQQFPAATEHLVFTPNHLSNFAGSRPIISGKVKWIVIPTTPKEVWVQEAFNLSPDSLSIVLGRSTHAGTKFQRYKIATPTPNQSFSLSNGPQLVYTRQGNQALVSMPATREKIQVKTDSMRVAIFYDSSRRQDAAYVRAALAALRTYTQRPVTIQLISNSNNLAGKLNWLFWLSDTAIPAKINREIPQGLFILKDAPTLVKSIPANWLIITGLPEPILLNQQAPVSRENQLQTWQNNYGESVLHLVPEGKGGTYYFASRFNSQWNSLPESSYFPEILSSLIWPESAVKADARAISEAQV